MITEIMINRNNIIVILTVIMSNANSNSNINDSSTVSFHNFKSQMLKLSVSNPKSEYVAFLSVLSQISNCQSLGRKNKHEILKTDRSDINVNSNSRPGLTQPEAGRLGPGRVCPYYHE